MRTCVAARQLQLLGNAAVASQALSTSRNENALWHYSFSTPTFDLIKVKGTGTWRGSATTPAGAHTILAP